MLNLPGEDGDRSAPRGSIGQRSSYQYVTLRANEETSVCLAARTPPCASLETLYFERMYSGQYKGKRAGDMFSAYSRLLIARANFVSNVGFLGKKQVIAVAH